MTFPTRLKSLRNRCGLNQRELADIMGMGREIISAYENGRVQPSIEMLLKLADYFRVSTDFLLGRDKALDDSAELDEIKQLIDELLELGDFIPRYAKTVNRLNSIMQKT